MQLDNPVWSALTSGHASFARGDGLARRYPSTMSPLSAVCEDSPEAFADLLPLVGPEDRIGLMSAAPLNIPDGWDIAFERWIEQMVCEEPELDGPALDGIVELGEDDADAMAALTAATQP